MRMWEDRFWAKVEKTDGCWNWKGAMNAGGYGSFGVEGVTYLAHRLSWGMSNKTDPAGLYVCHRCDNPRCVRPDHLFLGTATDNVNDRDSKRRGRWRGRPGTTNSLAKLTDDSVRKMRRRQSDGASYTDLAREFGVTRMVAWRICQRRSWAHVE